MLSKQQTEGHYQIPIVSLDDLVPEDHLVRKIEKAIDFSFIYDLVKDRYSPDQGRPSIDPVVLIKMIFIQPVKCPWLSKFSPHSWEPDL